MSDFGIFAAIMMGLVQGLTEFLPVSSSAHLVFADHFLHLRLSEADTVSFDVLLHLGTLVAVLVYFRRDVWLLLRGLGQLTARPRTAWRDNANSRLAVWLMLGTVPAAILGVALKDFFEQAFQNVPGTAMLLFVTAVMLIWISRRKHGERTMEHITAKDALLIGLFQAVAILPGISRSGSTITGGLLRGLDRDAAPRFSFLLSIPIILAGGLFDLKDTLETGFTLPLLPLAAGFVAAAVSGYLAVVLLLGVVRRGRLDRFAYYCIAAGAFMLAYWTLLVPKAHDLVGYVEQQPVGVNAHGEMGPVEFGKPLQLRVVVKDGLVPVTGVYALAPVGGNHPAQRVTFSFDSDLPTAGKRMLTSEEYRIRPLSHGLSGEDDAETREIWVILRNEWGIENQVRLELKIVPASLSSRMA